MMSAVESIMAFAAQWEENYQQSKMGCFWADQPELQLRTKQALTCYGCLA